MRRSYCIALLLVGLVFGAAQLMDWWKHRHLITLDAQNAEIYPILKEVSRQSGIPVLAQANTTGQVTVHFQQTPVENALDVLAEQTNGRWEKLFLKGRTDSAIQTLAGVVVERGHPFLITRMTGRDNFFVEGTPSDVRAVSVSRIDFKIADRNLHTASLGLALKTRTPIMVEESLNPVLTLQINEPDLVSAVERLARAAKSKSEMAYHFRTPDRRGSGSQAGSPFSSQTWQELRAEWEKVTEQQIALLVPEDQQKIQQQRAEWQKRMAGWASLPQKESQEKLAELASGMASGMAGHSKERFDCQDGEDEGTFLRSIKSLTPEQRAQKERRHAAVHKH